MIQHIKQSINIADENSRKFILINSFSLLGILALFYFGILGLLAHRVGYSIIIFAIFLISSGNLFLLNVKKKLSFSSHFIISVMFFTDLLLFLFFPAEGKAVLWYFVFPPLSILLLGYKKGFAFSASLLLSSLVLYFSLNDYVAYSYSTNFLVRIVFAYIIITFMVLLFEYSRDVLQAKLNRNLKELSDKNEELQVIENSLSRSYKELFTLNNDIQTQKEVIENNSIRLSTILNNQGEGFGIIDFQGNFTFSNRMAAQIFEVEEAELLKKNIAEFVAEKELQLMFAHASQLKPGDKQNFDLELESNTGTTKTIHVTITLDTDLNENVNGIAGVFRDITKEKEEALRIKELNAKLHKYYTVIEQAQTTIVITDKDNIIEYVNPQFIKLTGYTKDEIIGEKISIVRSGKTPPETIQELKETLARDEVWKGEFINRTKAGREFWERATISPVKNKDGLVTNFVAIKEDITELKKAENLLNKRKQQLELAHSKIKDSLLYAANIQQALLTSTEQCKAYFQNYFLIFKPKEVVSGDFYYFNKVGNKLYVAIADCTGHGVAGGFLTMFGLTYLHEIITQSKPDTAADILEELRERIKSTFQAFGSNLKNGMDISISILEENKLQFSGAYQSLVLAKNKQLTEYKGVRSPIGFYIKEKPYVNQNITVNPGDTLYMFTDGMQDQFDKQNYLKFSKKRMLANLEQNQDKPLNQQKQSLLQALNDWKGDAEQIDDICFFAYQV